MKKKRNIEREKKRQKQKTTRRKRDMHGKMGLEKHEKTKGVGFVPCWYPPERQKKKMHRKYM